METHLMIEKNRAIFLFIILLAIMFISVNAYGVDLCPGFPKDDPGICGCEIPDNDSDKDGTPDCKDRCPNNPDKVNEGICGCFVSDDDSDSDGVADCNDLCKDDPKKLSPGICGCGTSDRDMDGDKTPDCNDECPDSPGKTEPGFCGCDTSDEDSDKDRVPDCIDTCPKDKGKTKPGICGCGVPDADSDGDGTLDCKEDIPLVLFTSPPTINPPDDPERGVSIGKAIEIYFNMQMNTNNISNHLVAVVDSSDVAVDGGSRWQDSGRKLVFTPADDLNVNTTYHVTVKGDIKDLNGTLLDGNLNGIPGGDHIFSFVTEVDGDRLSDDEEEAIGTEPDQMDSDGDTIPDDTEVGPDPQVPLNSDDDSVIDALDDDSDNDGIPDVIELNIDSDGDGTPDFRDVDSDNDGKLDEVEGASDDDDDGIANFKDANDADGPLGEQDGDGLTNTQEVALGTNPNLKDSDNDTISDLDEVGGDLDNPVDTDSDGMIDAVDTDSDNDGSTDRSEYLNDYNEDGISDHLNARSVAGLGVVMLLEEPSGAVMQGVNMISVDGLPEFGMPSADFIYGLINLKVTGLEPGQTAKIRLIFEDDIPADAKYFKFSNKDGWKIYDDVEGIEDGDNVLFLFITDGGVGDDDKTENGTIVDSSGIGILTEDSTSGTENLFGLERRSGSSGCSMNPSRGEADIGWLLLLVFPVALRLKRVFLS